MEEIILKQITSNVNFKKELVPRYEEIHQLNINEQAKMAPALFVMKEKFHKAFEIAVDTIDDLSLKCDGLTVELSKYGEIDEAKIRRIIETRQKNQGDQAKCERVRKELMKTMNKSKALTYK